MALPLPAHRCCGVRVCALAAWGRFEDTRATALHVELAAGYKRMAESDLSTKRARMAVSIDSDLQSRQLATYGVSVMAYAAVRIVMSANSATCDRFRQTV